MGTRGPPLLHDPPAAPAVRDELERILSSETFKRSERARELLSYLVGREQVGEAERLKGYAIAVDVFGKDSEFDSSTDAVVRVQAGRLRELLAQYYAAEGRHDPIRLVIPRGSYVPAYEEMPADWVACGQMPAQRAAAATPARSRRRSARRSGQARRPLKPGFGLGARYGCCGARWLWSPCCWSPSPTAPPCPGSPERPIPPPPMKSACRPRPFPSRRCRKRCRPSGWSPRAAMQATQRVAADFKAAFAGFDTLDLIDSDFADQHGCPPDPMSFALTGGSRRRPGGVRIELKSRGSGKVLLSRMLADFVDRTRTMWPTPWPTLQAASRRSAA